MISSRPVALVTGSSSGIGEAIARRLTADGFSVVIHSGRSVEAGTRLAAELGGHYLQADLADEQQTRALVPALLEHYARLDVLVNCAGISRQVPHRDLAGAPPALWHELFQVNMIAPWILCTEAEAALRASPQAGGGAIVNITSHAGVHPRGASVPYAASKAALGHTTKLLAAALAPAIRVNAVAPGLVDTPLTADWADIREMWAQRAPMGRSAGSDEVADLVAAVIANTYLTGQVIILDGGFNLA